MADLQHNYTSTCFCPTCDAVKLKLGETKINASELGRLRLNLADAIAQLQKIASADYRGNRSNESLAAFNTLQIIYKRSPDLSGVKDE